MAVGDDGLRRARHGRRVLARPDEVLHGLQCLGGGQAARLHEVEFFLNVELGLLGGHEGKVKLNRATRKSEAG